MLHVARLEDVSAFSVSADEAALAGTRKETLQGYRNQAGRKGGLKIHRLNLYSQYSPTGPIELARGAVANPRHSKE